MTFLLDTNVCIAALRRHPRVEARLSAATFENCAVSVVTVYELFTGTEKSREPDREKTKVRRFHSATRVLPFDQAAAEWAARVRAALERTGKTCGPYDLLLAGHALSRGLPLVTNNVREFGRVPGLVVEDWLQT